MTATSYKFKAAQQAFEMYGQSYADYIEAHTQELVDKGFDVADQSLSEALSTGQSHNEILPYEI